MCSQEAKGRSTILQYNIILKSFSFSEEVVVSFLLALVFSGFNQPQEEFGPVGFCSLSEICDWIDEIPPNLMFWFSKMVSIKQEKGYNVFNGPQTTTLLGRPLFPGMRETGIRQPLLMSVKIYQSVLSQPSIFSHVSGSWWQQTEQGNPDVHLLKHINQQPLQHSKMSPG